MERESRSTGNRSEFEAGVVDNDHGATGIGKDRDVIDVALIAEQQLMRKRDQLVLKQPLRIRTFGCEWIRFTGERAHGAIRQ